MSSTSSASMFGFPPGTPFESAVERNKEWASRMSLSKPHLFPTNAQGQSPQILWIGCSDSRVSEACLDLLPGEVFVHRNIGNLLPSGDLSSLSVLQYAVDVLKVKHIVVCGHYDCGGVWASLTTKKLGLIDNWLRHIKDVKARNKKELDYIKDPKEKADKLVELNVVQQVHNVKRLDNVMNAVGSGQLQVHGAVYDVATGLIKELQVPEDEDVDEYYITEHQT